MHSGDLTSRLSVSVGGRSCRQLCHPISEAAASQTVTVRAAFVSPDSGVVKAFCEPEFPAQKFASGIDSELFGHAMCPDSEEPAESENITIQNARIPDSENECSYSGDLTS